MNQAIYLASHDLGPEWRPRVCEIIGSTKSARGRYMRVRIDPPASSKAFGQPETIYREVLLATVRAAPLNESNMDGAIVDIIVCAHTIGATIDETDCARIGMGSLHTAYEDALRNSPSEAG